MSRKSQAPSPEPWAMRAGRADASRALSQSAANYVPSGEKVYRGVDGFDAEAVRNIPVAMVGVQGVQRGTSPHIDGLRRLVRSGR